MPGRILKTFACPRQIDRHLVSFLLTVALTNALQTRDCDPLGAPEKCHYFLRGARLETGLHPAGTFGSSRGNELLGKSMKDAAALGNDTDPAFFRSYKVISERSPELAGYLGTWGETRLNVIQPSGPQLVLEARRRVHQSVTGPEPKSGG